MSTGGSSGFGSDIVPGGVFALAHLGGGSLNLSGGGGGMVIPGGIPSPTLALKHPAILPSVPIVIIHMFFPKARGYANVNWQSALVLCKYILTPTFVVTSSGACSFLDIQSAAVL